MTGVLSTKAVKCSMMSKCMNKPEQMCENHYFLPENSSKMLGSSLIHGKQVDGTRAIIVGALQGNITLFYIHI